MYHQIRLFEELFFFFLSRLLSSLFKFEVCAASNENENKKGKNKSVLLSDMPADILNCIQERLPLADYLRFPAVCAPFRSAADRISRLPFSDTHSPWLLTFGSLRSDKLTATAAPLSPPPPPGRRKHYSIPFPPLFKGHRILSSDRHRLFIEDQCFRSPPSQGIYIVNPFDSWTLLGRLPLSPSSSRLGKISNLAVSNTDTVALGICSELHLVYTRMTTSSSCSEDIDGQHRRWIPLDDKLPPPAATNGFQDVVAYKDDSFYVVRMNATNVLALDFSSSPTRVTDMTLNLQPCRDTPGWSCFQDARLIASPSGLFLVRWRCLLKPGKEKRREIDVYRLMDDEYAPNKWVQINSLDGSSFFFAMHSSLSFSPADIRGLDIPGLRSNCIYLPHDATWNVRHDYTDFYEGDIDNFEDVTPHLICDLAGGSWGQLYGDRSLGSLVLVTPRLRADR